MRDRKQVVIVTIFYRERLSPDEQISLQHMLHYLGDYDKFIIKGPHIRLSHDAFRTVILPKRHFQNARTHGQLELMRKYYEPFAEYEYMLVYELDAIVFSDQLSAWCDKGYDFIGAPWIRELMEKRYDYPDAVGNGGFSLRKISTMLQVIDKAKKPMPIVARDMLTALLDFSGGQPKKYARTIRHAWSTTAAHRTLLNEDRFWAFEAPTLLPTFRLPTIDEALRFAFETNPRKAFEKTGHTLPFGCHAWTRYDRPFWEPYLLKLSTI